MSNLRDFAAFVKDEKLDEFISSDYEMIKAFNTPLLEVLKHLDEADLLNRIKESLISFLDGLINGNAIKAAKERLEAWEQDKLPGIPRNAISISDIILVYEAQKLSLFQLITSYTKDSSIAIAIVSELEIYYKDVWQISTRIIKKIEEQEKQKLLESEERYKDLFDNANDLIHFVNPEGYILYVNKAWTDTLKYSTDELKGRKIYSIISEKDRENFVEHRKKVLSGIINNEIFTTCFVCKDGKEVTVEGSITCKFKDNVPQYTRSILRDITKKKEDEQKLRYYNEQLREREENLNRLIQNAPDAIIVIDAKSKILLWNPKSENIFGWKSEEVIGKDISETIIPEEYREAHRSGMNRYLSTGEIHVLYKTIEITALHKNNTVFFISLTISQTYQGGEIVFVAFMRDITLQKQNEIELENKRKQLEKSNEELEQYAWLASHDLKEPLRKIMTFTDILLTRYTKDLPEVVQRHLQKIDYSTQRMNSLIEAIMVYSNVTDNTDLFVETDLLVIVKEVLIDLEVAIKNKNATIHVSALPKVEAIKIQMRQLLQNLISNAIKYSKPDTPPVVDITSEVKDGYCNIKIRDNGIGFDNQYSEKIFQVFQRLSTGERYEGTGIGLALCKKIVDTHNGTIYAKSADGQGSAFYISLPIKHITKDS